jgi:hypothetical protein
VPRSLSPNPTEAAKDQEFRRELDRMNHLLDEPPPRPPRPSAVPEQPVPGPGPVTSSGGHPQPTPAEIEERQRQLGRGPPAPQRPVTPVYDLFGQRIQ